MEVKKGSVLVFRLPDYKILDMEGLIDCSVSAYTDGEVIVKKSLNSGITMDEDRLFCTLTSADTNSLASGVITIDMDYTGELVDLEETYHNVFTITTTYYIEGSAQPQPTPANYYTKTETDNHIASAITASAYTKTETDSHIASAITASAYTKSQVDSKLSAATSGLTSKEYVDNAISGATSGMATTGYVQTAITNQQFKTINGEVITGTGNITISGGSGVSKAQWLIEVDYNSSDEQWVVVSTSGYVQSLYTTLKSYEDNNKMVDFWKENDIYINDKEDDHIVVADGICYNYAEGQGIRFAINGDCGRDSFRVAIGDNYKKCYYNLLATEHSVSIQIRASAYTKSEVDSKIASATTDMASETFVEEKIDEATEGMATESWVTDQGYLTEHQSLANYSTTAQMNSAISGATSGMATTGYVQTAISNQQFKTINGQSIKGSGNIVISSNTINNAGSAGRPIYISGGTAIVCNSPSSGNYTGFVPNVGGSGVMEVGQYIDLHTTASTNDYDLRLQYNETDDKMQTKHTDLSEMYLMECSNAHTVKILTQTQYDALSTKDSKTIYIIKG